MLTLITPCCRPQNLAKIKESIQFDKIQRWIIVYDTTKNRTYEKQFEHPQIEEVFCDAIGISGNQQRNFGAAMVSEGHIYFVDDDNIVHPEFWTLTFEPAFFYTFDQLRNKSGHVLRGSRFHHGQIDTAMFVVPKSMWIDWNPNKYEADFLFISQINRKFGKHAKYFNKIACYYNYLTSF